MLIYEDGHIVGTIGGGEVEHRVIRAAQQAILSGRAERFTAHLTRDLGMCCGGLMEVYIEPLQIRSPLVIFGAGHVAAAVAPLLEALDFDVTIVDDREDLNSAERFPGCARHTGDPRDYAAQLAPNDAAHWLIVTHDHKLDQDLGETLLPKSCAWIGMIGSRAKVAKFFIRYRAAGLPEALYAKLSAPVGLDIGAETPTEIAVAIAAELVRVRRHADRAPIPLSQIPLPARGADGVACPPLWKRKAPPS